MTRYLAARQLIITLTLICGNSLLMACYLAARQAIITLTALRSRRLLLRSLWASRHNLPAHSLASRHDAILVDLAQLDHDLLLLWFGYFRTSTTSTAASSVSSLVASAKTRPISFPVSCDQPSAGRRTSMTFTPYS